MILAGTMKNNYQVYKLLLAGKTKETKKRKEEKVIRGSCIE
jgi:hypothetical protein